MALASSLISPLILLVIHRFAGGEAQKVSRLSYFLCYFEVYCQAIIELAAFSVQSPLQRALAKYRMRLSELAITNNSVRECNAAFMLIWFLGVQDDPQAQSMRDEAYYDILVRKMHMTSGNRIREPVRNPLRPSGYHRPILLKGRRG